MASRKAFSTLILDSQEHSRPWMYTMVSFLERVFTTTFRTLLNKKSLFEYPVEKRGCTTAPSESRAPAHVRGIDCAVLRKSDFDIGEPEDTLRSSV